MEKKDKPSADSFDFEEDDIIDLSDTLQDDEIIDLTSSANPPDGDETEELLDLDSYIAEKGGVLDDEDEADNLSFDDTDDVIDLVQPVGDVEDDDIIELVEAVSPSGKAAVSPFSFDEDEDVIELTEPVTQILGEEEVGQLLAMDDDGDDTIDLIEPITQGLDSDDDFSPENIITDEEDLDLDYGSGTTVGLDEEDIIELETPAVITDSDGLDDDIIDLTQTVDEDDVIDLETPAVVTEGDGLDDDIIDLIQTVDDEDDVIDLETPAVIAGGGNVDEEIIDLTQMAAASDNDNDEIIELTAAVEGDEKLEGFLNFDETGTATLDDEISALDLIEETDEELQEEILDLTESANTVDSSEDSLDDMIEEIILDLDEPVKTAAGFNQFAEQTSDNLQFDLSESLSGETSKHTIINAEPVKSPFDFESFAEQTTDKLSFLANIEAQKDKNEQKPVQPVKNEDGKRHDIDDEIMNFSLDTEDFEGLGGAELENTVEMSEIPSRSSSDKEDLLKELDDTFDGEVIELTDILDDTETSDGVDDDLLDTTWDGSGETGFDDSGELEFDEIDGLIQTPKDDDQTIAEVLGLDMTDEKGNQEAGDDEKLRALGITQAQLDLSVERVIKKMYSEKLDQIFKEVIGRTISEDIERIKEVLKRDHKDK